MLYQPRSILALAVLNLSLTNAQVSKPPSDDSKQTNSASPAVTPAERRRLSEQAVDKARAVVTGNKSGDKVSKQDRQGSNQSPGTVLELLWTKDPTRYQFEITQRIETRTSKVSKENTLVPQPPVVIESARFFDFSITRDSSADPSAPVRLVFHRIIWKTLEQNKLVTVDTEQPATGTESELAQSLRQLVNVPMSLTLDRFGRHTPGSKFELARQNTVALRELASNQWQTISKASFSWLPNELLVKTDTAWERIDELPISSTNLIKQSKVLCEEWPTDGFASFSGVIQMQTRPTDEEAKSANIQLLTSRPGTFVASYDPRSKQIRQLKAQNSFAIEYELPTKSGKLAERATQLLSATTSLQLIPPTTPLAQ